MRRFVFARFLLAGVANSAVGLCVIVLLQAGIGVDRRLANAAGYLVGGVVAYVLNRAYTFSSTASHARTMPRFILAAVGCFALNILVLEFCVRTLEWPVFMAQVAALTTYTLTFYVVSRRHVFRA